MNKRIRELAHEAGLPTYNPDGIPTKLEKFAELIIKDCVNNVKMWEKDSRNHISYMLKEHFGIE